MYSEVLPYWHLVYPLWALLWDDDDLALTPLDIPEADRPIDLSGERWVLWPPCLEEFGDPWQSTGDIAWLVDLPSALGECLSRLDRLAIPDRELSTDGDDDVVACV